MGVKVQFDTSDALANLAPNQERVLILIGSSAYGNARAAAMAAAAGNTGNGAITRKFSYAAGSGFKITTVDSGGTKINAQEIDLAVAAAATPATVAADLQAKIRAATGHSGTEIVEWNDTEKRFEISDADLSSTTFAAPATGDDVTEQLGFVTGKMDAVNNKVYGFPIGPAKCGAETKDETWTFECSQAVADSGVFTVTGSVSGEQAEKLTVGAAWASDGGEIADVHIADGSANWAVGDTITMRTYASKINKLTPVASVAQYRTAFGEIKSGVNLSIKNVNFKSDDYLLGMLLCAMASGIGEVYILSAKAHGYSRATEPTNEEYYEALLILKQLSTPKIVIHESQTPADQIDLAQVAFEECGPTTMHPTFALFSYGINGSQTNYTDAAKAIDDGVTRGTNTDGIVPYALIAPAADGALDENDVLHETVQRSIAAGAGAFRCLEPDPAMPLHEELEIGGLGGLSNPWLPAEHDALNAGGVATLKTKGGARIVIHTFVTCVNLQSNGPTVYLSWHHESVVWACLYVMEALRDLYTNEPYARTKNTDEIRNNMRPAVM